jgi:rhodanese-related sulfurtransferase
MSAPNVISPERLMKLVGTPSAPIIIDVRTPEDFDADPRLIPSAICRSHGDVAAWAPHFEGKAVVAVCHHGAKLSHGAAAWLRHCGAGAQSLEDGFEGWKSVDLPLIPVAKIPPRDDQGRTLWVTRARPKIDRIACPWLIRRFVDPSAIFLFVAPSEVVGVAIRFSATPFDIENTFWSHRGVGPRNTASQATGHDHPRCRYCPARSRTGSRRPARCRAWAVPHVQRRPRTTRCRDGSL